MELRMFKPETRKGQVTWRSLCRGVCLQSCCGFEYWFGYTGDAFSDRDTQVDDVDDTSRPSFRRSGRRTQTLQKIGER